MLELKTGEGVRQSVEVQRAAFVVELFAATLGVQRLAVEIIDLGAFDIGGARGFALRAAVRVPALLPVGEPGFGVLQRLLTVGVGVLQCVQPGFGVGDLAAQHVQTALIAFDVLADFRQRLLGFVAGALQALAEFALMRDLLFDAGERTADFVTRGLGLVQGLGGGFAALAAGFDLTLGLALLGDGLLQPGLFLRQALAQRLQLGVEQPEFQRFPLGILDPALGLDRLVLLGLSGLPREMLQLFADFFAQVVEAVEILAGVADAGLGFLAAFLVFGDAGGFFQIHAQFFGLGLDDLRDHALFDDRVAARAQAGAEEQVGDVAAPAFGAVEVVVALAVAADLALDRNFVERGVFAGDGVVGVVEDQFDRGLRDRFTGRAAGKDHVGQRVAAQAAGRAFAHHPADGVDDVRLAASVRPHHAGHVRGQVQGGRIDEGLEAGELDGGKTHALIGYSAGPTAWSRRWRR